MEHEGGAEVEPLAGGVDGDPLIPGSVRAREVASSFLFAEQQPVPLEEDRRAVLQVQVSAWSSEVKLPLRTGDPNPCEADQIVTFTLAVYAWANNEGSRLLVRAVAVGSLFWGPENTPWRNGNRGKSSEKPVVGPRECTGSGERPEGASGLPERRRAPPGGDTRSGSPASRVVGS